MAGVTAVPAVGCECQRLSPKQAKASERRLIKKDRLWNFAADTSSNHIHLRAKDLPANCTDKGAQGERQYHPGYYAAFLLGPYGNNIKTVYHGPFMVVAEFVMLKPAAA